MIGNNGDCPFKFRLHLIFLFLLVVNVSAESATDKESVQKDLLKLFDRPLLRTPESSVEMENIYRLTYDGDVKREAVEPGTNIIPKIGKYWVDEIISFGSKAFFPLINKHVRIASYLIQIFMNTPTIEQLLKIAGTFKNVVNPDMFNYALSVVFMNRNDTNGLPLPANSELFPDKYVNDETMIKIKEAIKKGKKEPIAVYRTGTNLEIENRIAYFREDICVNLHHWNWHEAHPNAGSYEIVNKDRRGELFYYLHHQILARYNAERLSNKLPRVKRLNNFEEPIVEGYYPKLYSQMSSKFYPARADNTILKDLDRPSDEEQFDISDLKFSADRILEAIYAGRVLHKNGTQIPLTEDNGIDIMGNIVEGSKTLSPNFEYYGSLHDNGHTAIGCAHDPDNSHLQEPGVMANTATAMRDPVFYRWHAYIDDLFTRWKNTLKPYTYEQLNFPDVEVSDVQIVSETGAPNHVKTFGDSSVIDISKGLDFKPLDDPILIKFNHLNHTSFKYKFKIMNRGSEIQTGTVRIFIAPRFDERGQQFPFSDQKRYMIDMDTFSITLKPGENFVERESSNSSVTVPFYTISDHLEVNDTPTLKQFNGCGWPHHMLLPKGTKDGFPMDLFVMVSNDTCSFIDQDEMTGMKSAPNMCGLRKRKYPDGRAMGYPFDRRVPAHLKFLQQFVEEVPNMATTVITVNFTGDEII